MIDKPLIVLTLFFLLVMCSVKTKQADEVETNIDETELFKSVYDTLDQMKIPITLTWKKWNSLYEEHLKRYGLKQGENTTDHPFAKLVERKKYKAFVFTSTDETGSPIIITFDKDGKSIDGFSLLGDVASNDPSNWTKELAIINEDLSIELIDSVWTYDLDSAGERIESSEKLTTKNELYRILDTGKFEKIQ